MRKMIDCRIATAELLNELYNLGYRFITECDYKITEFIEPLSGMPCVDCHLCAFDNKEEAEAFAEKQIWVFSKDVHATVKEIPPHTQTKEEWYEEFAKEQADKKAKKVARDTEKARAEGLTLEEYRAKKNLQRRIRKVKNEIADLEEELANKKKYLEKLEKEY